MALDASEVKDVADLVQYLLAAQPPGRLWFRGQGCDKRKLTTSLGRKLTSTSPAHMLQVEQRLITRFRQRSLPLWPEGYPQSDWEHLFAMQHFGVPTRLLDWTEGLLQAAYFAADHDPKRCECGTGGCRPTVWAIDPVQFNQRNPRLEGMGVAVLTTTEQAAQAWAPGVTETQFAPWPVAVHGTHNSARSPRSWGRSPSGAKNTRPWRNRAPLQPIRASCRRLSSRPITLL